MKIKMTNKNINKNPLKMNNKINILRIKEI